MSKVMTAIAPKKMKLFGMPTWFHHHGTKISYIGFDNQGSPERIMLLESSAVEIRIHRRGRSENAYIVEYRITQSPDSFNYCHICMSKKNLEEAFGLSNTCPEFGGQWLADEYGADVAQQGQYIRYGKFLNIPGPGTGNDGDPNVSILVDEKMQKVIREILFHNQITRTEGDLIALGNLATGSGEHHSGGGGPC